MLATGRRLEDVSTLTPNWVRIDLPNSSYIIRFNFYDSWTGKAERPLDDWESPRITLLAIDPVDNNDQVVLCPLRAFNCFWSLRQRRIFPADLDKFLWGCNPVSLSYAVNNLLLCVQKHFYPGMPMHLRPKLGTHNLRKFAISYCWIYFRFVEKVLLDRVGSRYMTVLKRIYIRMIHSPPFNMAIPIGTLKFNMVPVRTIEPSGTGPAYDDEPII